MPDIEVLVRRPAKASQRPPLLFVHGAYMGAWCWDEHFMPYLAAAGFECRAVSLRGHGGSAGADVLDRAGIADYVDDVATAAAGWERAPVVVGHSMGGIVALHYARACGAAAVILIGCVPPSGVLAASVDLCLRAPDLYAQFVLVQSGQRHWADVRRLSAALFADDMPVARAAGFFRRMGRESQRVLTELSWPYVCGVRAPCDVPVAVIGGEGDRLFTADATRAVARWHATQAAILPGLAHTLMLDRRWRDAAEWIAGWLDEQPAP
jgi:pimeloyl-ACP methyl ester carboxylesterase